MRYREVDARDGFSVGPKTVPRENRLFEEPTTLKPVKQLLEASESPTLCPGVGKDSSTPETGFPAPSSGVQQPQPGALSFRQDSKVGRFSFWGLNSNAGWKGK